MKISKNGIIFIMNQEGFRSKPYLDSGNIPTIGIGTTVYPNGKKVTMQDPEITKEQAFEFLENHLEKNVYNVLNHYNLTQNMFDALCSFIYNEGSGNFHASKMKDKIEKDVNDLTIRQEFNKWIYCNHKVINGLVERRKREADLYFS